MHQALNGGENLFFNIWVKVALYYIKLDKYYIVKVINKINGVLLFPESINLSVKKFHLGNSNSYSSILNLDISVPLPLCSWIKIRFQ
jgi:hypothetical protein